MSKKQMFIFVITLFTFLSLTGVVKADEVITVDYQKTNPNDSYQYTFKRIKEKATLFFLSISTNKKANYYQNLLNTRLAEVKYVIDKKDIANHQTSTQRYSATAGQLTEFILKNTLDTIKPEVIRIMESHIPVLQNLQNSYAYDTAEWRFIQYDIDDLNTLIKKLS